MTLVKYGSCPWPSFARIRTWINNHIPYVYLHMINYPYLELNADRFLLISVNKRGPWMNFKFPYMREFDITHCRCRDHFVDVPSQWETALHCNAVSHWLGAYIESSLPVIYILVYSFIASKSPVRTVDMEHPLFHMAHPLFPHLSRIKSCCPVWMWCPDFELENEYDADFEREIKHANSLIGDNLTLNIWCFVNIVWDIHLYHRSQFIINHCCVTYTVKPLI